MATSGSLAFGQSVAPGSSPSNQNSQDLTDLPIEDLMQIDVTNAFKTPMPVMQVPAAFYVVTQDEIRRGGATNIPEALRLVPGVDVMRASADYYIVTVRGFANDPSNKLLVLLDGRSLYTPYQNGVYWEIEDVAMDNIDRIEVIRGPGGSLWGANAVNGVINIITKNSADTKGGLFSQSVGSFQDNMTSLRYGTSLGELGSVRLYGKYGVQSAAQNPDGSSYGDGADLFRGGFRADLNLGHANSLLLEGSLNRYNIAENQPIALATSPYSAIATTTDSITTSDVLARWEQKQPNGALSSAQLYYDLVNYPYTDESSEGTTYDLELDQRLAQSRNQSIAFGLGWRYMINDTAPGPSTLVLPSVWRNTIISLYGQDDIKTSPLTHVTVGMKVEHNDMTGYEFEPNLRISYAPDANHTFWGAIGRAVRTPSQTEANIFALNTVSPPTSGQTNSTATATLGNPNLKSESLIANELGYRAQLSPKTSLDISAFYNIYQDLVYQESRTAFNSSLFGPTLTIVPSVYENGDHGQTYGLEVSSKSKISQNLRADFGLSVLRRSNFVYGTDLGSPMYQATAHFAWDISRKFEVDAMLHWYDAIFDQQVPAYTKLDLHIGWKPVDRFELSVGGYDLFVPRHIEYGGSASIPRSFVINGTYRF